MATDQPEFIEFAYRRARDLLTGQFGLLLEAVPVAVALGEGVAHLGTESFHRLARVIEHALRAVDLAV